MKRIALFLLMIVLLQAFAAAETAESTILPIIDLTISTPKPAGEVFSCETLIITLPEGYTILEENENSGYTAAVEDAYQLNAQLLFAAQNEAGGAICTAMIEDATPALEACKAAAQNMLGSSETASEYTYGENTYAGFACALDNSVFQIYYISDGSRLVTVSTANISAEETAALLESMVF